MVRKFALFLKNNKKDKDLTFNEFLEESKKNPLYNFLSIFISLFFIDNNYHEENITGNSEKEITAPDI